MTNTQYPVPSTQYLTLLLFLLFTAGLLLAGLFVGSFETDLGVIQQVITAYDSENPVHYAIAHLRLPRLLLAFLVGGALAFSGYLLQLMVNNPIADPYILGTASGAAFGANVVFFGLLPVVWFNFYLPPVFAFLGAFGITFLVVTLAYKQGQIIPSQLLLSGVAISSLLTALNNLFTFLSDNESKLKTIIFWSLGSFERAQWLDIPLLLGTVVLANVVFSLLHKQLNLLLLGENRAFQLGLSVSHLRWAILLATSLVTGVAVASSGAIGFVGLVVPHVIRGIFGVSNRWNLVFTTWLGGIYMLGCDLLARLIYPPAGLPVGILTSFLGVPFFLYLLLRKNYRFD